MASSADPSVQHDSGTQDWQRFPGRKIDVLILAASPQVSQASDLVGFLDRAATTLQNLLVPGEDRSLGKIDIYLTPPGVTGEWNTTLIPGNAINVGPDSRNRPASVTEPLTYGLVTRWYGAKAAAAAVIMRGIVGVLDDRLGIRPAIDEANARALDILRTGRNLSIFPFDTGWTGGGDADASAISFVSYLINVFGSATVGEFLLAFDPEREDAASQHVFYQPLGALEEAWQRAIQHHAEGRSAFRTLFRHLRPLLAPYKRRVAELLLLMAGGVALTIAVPLTIMHIVDHILPHAHGEYDDLIFYIGLLLLLFITSSVINARRMYAQHWINQRAMMSLRHDLYSHLQRLSHNYFSRISTSNLMTLLNNDAREIQTALAMVVGNGLYLALLALSTAVTVLLLNFILGVLVLLIVPVFAAGYVTLRSRWQREAHGFQRLQSEADRIAYENFSAHGEIKAFGLQDHAIATYRQRHQDMFGRQLRLINLSGLFESTLHIASGLGYVVVFGVGGYLVISERGGVTIGTLFAFAHLLPLFYEPIERLADLGHTVEGAANAFEQIDMTLAEPIVVSDRPQATDLPLLSREVRFENVTFGYSPGRPVLDDLSMTIPAGADVAIVGPSGCGKSTVINLLLRFWDPDKGRILFDGQELRDVRLASLRDQMGLVFAETFIFDTSVRENIAIGNPDASDAEIERAAKLAQFDQFVNSLPAGYNTVLGERGVRMSSGQRQRMAIARALLRQPRLLLLDEATSSLDPRTESELLETLMTVGQERTTISVQHRLASVATADLILVLDQGKLAEQGQHAELVKAGGLYQKLYEEQMHYLHGGGVLRIGVDVERLRLIPLFADFEPETIKAVAEQFMLERFAAGEVVVKQGDPGDKLYMISHGEADVVASIDGKERLLDRLARGGYFGEMALLTNEPRNATIRTVTPSQFFSLAAEDFQALQDRIPEVKAAVLKTFEERRGQS